MSRAEKEYVDGREVVVGRKPQIGFAIESCMDIAQGIAGIACTMDEDNLHGRVVEQQTQQLTRRVACATDDTDFHYFLVLRACTL